MADDYSYISCVALWRCREGDDFWVKECIIAFFAIMFVIVTYLYVKLRSQIKDITEQIEFIEKNQSNALVTSQIEIGGLKGLKDVLNKLFEKHRAERIVWKKRENEIADIYTNLSHDIRTPLTSLDGYFQLLSESDDKEKNKRYIAIIQERIKALRDMLEELFTFTKLENKTYNIKLYKCDLNEIVRETLFSYYEEWEMKKIVPTLKLSDESLYFYGNEQVMHRILQNVIKNVLEHGEKKVEISLYASPDKISLTIQNEVLNPDEIDINRIFEKFYKADAARSKTSTGLGMAIAKEMTECMGGKISASLHDTIFIVNIEFKKA